VLNQAADTTTVLPKTLDFSPLSEFLVGTGKRYRLAYCLMILATAVVIAGNPSAVKRTFALRRTQSIRRVLIFDLALSLTNAGRTVS
jgi:hypothetical protein